MVKFNVCVVTNSSNFSSNNLCSHRASEYPCLSQINSEIDSRYRQETLTALAALTFCVRMCVIAMEGRLLGPGRGGHS